MRRGPYAPEEDGRIRELWQTKLSCAEIGKLIGRSKDQVVGRVHRLDLPKRPSPIQMTGNARKRVRRQAKPTIAAPGPVPPIVVTRRGLPCCWPLGEPGKPGFRYCDAPDVIAGKPYCAEHAAKAYVRVRSSEPFTPPPLGRLLAGVATV